MPCRAEARGGKGYTQEKLAQELNFSDRNRISNWERDESTTLPHLKDFCRLCKILECDPNYLLGISNDKSIKKAAIAEDLGISVESIDALRDSQLKGRFINSTLSSKHLDEALFKVSQLITHHNESIVLDSIFTTKGLEKLKNAFNKFRQETFAFDMDEETFAIYVQRAFPWNPEKQTFDELLRSVIKDERYYEMVYSNPIFPAQSDEERYATLMWDIAKTYFPRLLKRPIAELAEQDLTKLLMEIINEFILCEISSLKKLYKNRTY